MARSKPEETKPFNYFHEVEAAQKLEKRDAPNIVTTLRADMVPASDIQPAKESILSHDTLKILLGIILGLVILGLILFTLVGPGRPILESSLSLLAQKAVTPTLTPSATLIPPTKTPLLPTKTPSPSPTIQATKTPVVNNSATPRRSTSTASPTTPECRDALSITLDDVGKTLCVRGVVLETITNPTDFMVIFSYERGAFYWVSYDVVWSNAEKNTCYQVHGTIDRIGNSPMLVFDYQSLPEACP
jgi:hypothetical protein